VTERATGSRWTPVVLYMAFLFGLSSMPHPPQPPPTLDVVSDQAAHVLLYAGLASLVLRALAGGWSGAVTGGMASLAVTISILYGVTDEIHQHFVPPREMDAMDLVADAVGATLAASALYIASRVRKR
jgi:VanZ family protein